MIHHRKARDMKMSKWRSYVDIFDSVKVYELQKGEA